MEPAAKVLVVGGVLNLALSFVIGFIWSAQRRSDPRRDPERFAVAHRMALWQGFMLLGLVFAVTLSPLSRGLELTAAWLLVAGTVFQNSGSLLNAVQRVDDQFAERSPGLMLATVNAALATLGLAILVVGVFAGL